MFGFPNCMKSYGVYVFVEGLGFRARVFSIAGLKMGE